MDSFSFLPRSDHFSLGTFRASHYKIRLSFDHEGFPACIDSKRHSHATVELYAPFAQVRPISKEGLKALEQKLPHEYSIRLIKSQFKVEFTHKLCGVGTTFSKNEVKEEKEGKEE